MKFNPDGEDLEIGTGDGKIREFSLMLYQLLKVSETVSLLLLL